MAHGSGQTDIERRVLALERKAWSPEIANAEVRLVALEQAKFQDPPGSNADNGPRIMFVTTTITAKSGSTTGVGQAADAAYDDSTGDMTAGSGDPIDVRNYHEKGFLIGAIIAIFPRYGTWWAFDVDKCANYQ